MVSTRGCETREVYFAAGSFKTWFPAPDESPVSTNVHSGDSQRLLNGLAYMGGSVYGGRHYELTWSFLNRDQADLFRRLFMNRTGEWISYADPFAFNNMLSPLMGLPYLHYHVGSPFAFNDWGKQALFPTKDLDSKTGHPGVILKPNVLNMENEFNSTRYRLNGRETSLALSKPGKYTERVVIPDGWYGTFFAGGFEDGKRPFDWTFTRVDGELPAYVQTTLKNQVFSFGEGVWEITMKPVQEGHLAWASLRLSKYRTGASGFNPYEYDWTYPAGGGNLQVVPGSANLVTVNNYRGHFTASVTLEEVYSW